MGGKVCFNFAKAAGVVLMWVAGARVLERKERREKAGSGCGGVASGINGAP